MSSLCGSVGVTGGVCGRSVGSVGWRPDAPVRVGGCRRDLSALFGIDEVFFERVGKFAWSRSEDDLGGDAIVDDSPQRFAGFPRWKISTQTLPLVDPVQRSIPSGGVCNFTRVSRNSRK